MPGRVWHGLLDRKNLLDRNGATGRKIRSMNESTSVKAPNSGCSASTIVGAIFAVGIIAKIISRRDEIDWQLVGFIALMCVGLLVFFIPTLVAKSRKHPHLAWIVGANIIFGATGLGWLACLGWALWRPNPQFAIPVRIDSSPATVAAPDNRQTASKLEELLHLKQSGLISEDEYKQKRSDILSRFT